MNTPCPKCGTIHDETRYGKYCSLVCKRRDEIEFARDQHTPSPSITLRTPNASPRDRR